MSDVVVKMAVLLEFEITEVEQARAIVVQSEQIRGWFSHQPRQVYSAVGPIAESMIAAFYGR